MGDISFNGLISEQPAENYMRFLQVKKSLVNDTLVFANLEFPVSVISDKIDSHRFLHYSDREVMKDLLARLNIGCVSLANNHISDYKIKGLEETIDLLDELNISHTGAGWKPEHLQPVIIEKHRKKIGFVAYVDKGTNPEIIKGMQINLFDVNKVVEDIRLLKNKTDIIICSLHWGNDYSNYFTLNQQKTAHKLIDKGADIIMGHHSHVIQPYENYKGRHIFYSLGQLCFGDFMWEGNRRALKRKTKRGMIISFKDYELTGFEIIPTREKKGNYIYIPYHENINKKVKQLYFINKLMLKYTSVYFLMHVKETIFDRLKEFFTGYYRNPIKDLFEFKNIRKIRYLIRDYREK